MNHLTWQKNKISKRERQGRNGHLSGMIWFTGLSGSGKSTLAVELERELFNRGIHVYILDGDNVRQGLNKNLSFTPEDRSENIRRIGEVGKLFIDAGVCTLAAFISPYAEDRQMVRAMLEPGELIEIYVKCPLEECEKRDPKGLYKKARAGVIPDFTGISSPYEEPENPDLVLETHLHSVSECVEMILSLLEKEGFFK